MLNFEAMCRRRKRLRVPFPCICPGTVSARTRLTPSAAEANLHRATALTTWHDFPLD
jgi:hypothetical protein